MTHRSMAVLAPVFALALLMILAGPGALPARAQSDARCFAETGQCISGAIRAFWEQNGGLAVFGLPLGPQQELIGEGGRVLQVQWFERHRLELHPENPDPYKVLLGRVGVDRLVQQGRNWESFPRPDPAGGDSADCRAFRETGHRVCGEFLRAFRSYGLSFPGTPGISDAESIALFGLPISEPMTETIDGAPYTVQWFERGRFELHPENQPPFNVLFGRLGAELQNTTDASALQRGPWQLVSFGPTATPQAAATARAATLAFDGTRVTGTTGCNSFGGPYTATATSINFGSLVATLAACTDDAINQQERAILAALQGETPYAITGDQLRISYDQGRQALTYRAAPAAQPNLVSGTVTYRQRIALPSQAVIQVQLVDVSRADAPAIVLATTSFEAGGRQVPLPFELRYDPAQIDQRNTYAVQARITIDDHLRFVSTARYAVLTQGNQTSIEIVVEPV